MFHADLQQPSIHKDEEAVSAVVDLVEGWVNPFSYEQDLISIGSTAKAVPKDIVTDLMKAQGLESSAITPSRRRDWRKTYLQRNSMTM